MSDQALFAIVPLLSAVMLVIAGTRRLTRDHSGAAAHAAPATVARDRAGRYAPMLIAAVLIGHVVMLTWPQRLLAWAATLSRLIVLEMVYVAVGIVATVTVGFAILRALRTAVRGAVADAIFAAMLLVTMVSGLGVAILHRWALGWSAAVLTPYLQSLVTVQPQTDSLAQMPYLVRLHVFSTFLLLVLLPFSSPFEALRRVGRRADGDPTDRRHARAGEGGAGTSPPEWSAPEVAAGGKPD